MNSNWPVKVECQGAGVIICLMQSASAYVPSYASAIPSSLASLKSNRCSSLDPTYQG